MTRVLTIALAGVLLVVFALLRLASIWAPVSAAACAYVLELALGLLAGREPPHRDTDLRTIYPAGTSS